MIDALFWYTGLAVWVLIVFGVVSTLVIEEARRAFEPTLSLAARAIMSIGRVV